MRWRICNSRLRRVGAISALTVLSLALLVGVAAVAVDGGSLMEERRHVQATADAAALAAAADLFANYPTNQGIDSSGSAQSSALATAAANGFSNDGVQSLVTVNTSPRKYQAGPNVGKTLPAGYVEVIVQYNAGRTFSNVFGSGAVPVRGRAVARGQWVAASATVMLLNTSAANVLTATGSVSLNIAGGLQVNSSNPDAFKLTGRSSVSASSINVNSAAGPLPSSVSRYLLGSGGSSPEINYGGPIADPLRYLPAPDAAQLGLSIQGTNLHIGGNSSVALHPGIYQNGISVGGSATVTLHANADGTPGIYYLQGQNGLSISGSASVTTAAKETAGVLIYNDWQDSNNSIGVTGSGSLTLTPPSSGPYQGISIFQKRGTPSTAAPPLNVTGSGSINVAGTIYAAYANITFTGSGGGSVLGGQIIADSFTATGHATLNVNRGTQSIANTRVLGLVE